MITSTAYLKYWQLKGLLMSDEFLNRLSCSELTDLSFKIGRKYLKDCEKWVKNDLIPPEYIDGFLKRTERYLYRRQGIDKEFERKLRKR